MPSSDYIVKDPANADVTFKALSSAGQDGNPARWRVESSNPPIFRAKSELKSRPNASRDARTVEGFVNVPVNRINAAGNPELVGNIQYRLTAVIPESATDSWVDYAQAVALGSFGSPQFRSTLKSGYAP